MLPFSMKCTTCGEYIYKGRKFNARKETPVEERYLGIQIYRFFIRCTRCSAEIIFKTDPRNQNYVCERGGKRNTDPWKRGLGDDPTRGETDDQRLGRLERETAEEEERNAMAELEAKTVDAKREMAIADALDEIRSRNARIERANREGAGVEEALPGVEDEERARQEKEDEEAARKAFAFARSVDQMWLDGGKDDQADGESGKAGVVPGPVNSTGSDAVAKQNPPPSSLSTDSPAELPPSGGAPAPTFKRQVKKKKDHSALLGIKKKKPLV